MAETATRLPRGRHGIPRAEIETTQRLRIMIGMAEAVGANGYVATPVAEVLKRAGVSRETFYQLYSSKQDCFLATLDLVGGALLAQLAGALDPPGTPLERFERALDVYLDTLLAQPAFARLFLVEVHAAGPEAMARRAQLQTRLVDALGTTLGAGDDADRVAGQLLVAAVGALVSVPLVTGDEAGVRAVGALVLDHVRHLTGGHAFFGQPQAGP